MNAEIQLLPFTLHEAELLLRSQEVTLSRYDILQLYMTVGGIPMYLSYVKPGLSLAQNIDQLFFNRKAKLKDEFERLFNSLFRSPEPYKTIILRGMDGEKGMQLDLVISRSDRVVNLCEMKFVTGEFEVKNDYEMKLRERIQWMVEHVSRRHNVQMTLVTTYGLKFGMHSGIFQRVVTMDSLFGGCE